MSTKNFLVFVIGLSVILISGCATGTTPATQSNTISVSPSSIPITSLFPTSTSSPTPEIQTIIIDNPVPASYTTYTDPNGLFKISYPGNWEIPPDRIQQFSESSNQVNQFLIGPINLQIRSWWLFSALNKRTFGASNLFFLPNEINPTPSHSSVNYSIYKTQVNGLNAILVECDSGDPDIGKLRILNLKIIANSNAWVIQCSSKPEEYEKWASDFRSIAGSLRILK